MKKLAILAMLILSSLIPVSAQFDQDDIERTFCVHIEIFTGSSGEFVHVFLYQDDFNALASSGQLPDFEIQVTEPNTTLEFNVLVAPQTLIAVATPRGFVEAFVLESGEFIIFGAGRVNWRFGDMDTECLGAATDGRINRFDQQMLAAIYDDGNGGYDVWAIDPATSVGRFDYNVSRAEVDAALARAATTWQEIESGSTSTLYATANGYCVLNSPNAGGAMQSFTFDCSGES